MAMTIPDAPEVVTPGDLGDLLASFTRSMRANNVSPNTILAYGGAVRQFAHRTTSPSRARDTFTRIYRGSGSASEAS